MMCCGRWRGAVRASEQFWRRASRRMSPQKRPPRGVDAPPRTAETCLPLRVLARAGVAGDAAARAAPLRVLSLLCPMPRPCEECPGARAAQGCRYDIRLIQNGIVETQTKFARRRAGRNTALQHRGAAARSPLPLGATPALRKELKISVPKRRTLVVARFRRGLARFASRRRRGCKPSEHRLVDRATTFDGVAARRGRKAVRGRDAVPSQSLHRAAAAASHRAARRAPRRSARRHVEEPRGRRRSPRPATDRVRRIRRRAAG